MANVTKLIRIVDALGPPPMETAFGMVLQVRSPRSDRSITVMVNPALEVYDPHPVDAPAVQVTNLNVMGITDDTQTFFFEFDGTVKYSFVVDGQEYELQLMKIDKAQPDGQAFPYYTYEFLVTRM